MQYRYFGWRAALLVTSLFLGVAAHAAYDPAADAHAEIKQALVSAKRAHKPVLLIFGANWCPDCRVLDEVLQKGKSADLINQSFKVVKVDVGDFNHNLDISDHYGSPIKKGIPAAVIVSPDDQILYITQAGELANARQMSADGIYEFFRQAADQTTRKRVQ